MTNGWPRLARVGAFVFCSLAVSASAIGCRKCSPSEVDREIDAAAKPNPAVLEMLGLRDAAVEIDAGRDAGPEPDAGRAAPVGLDASRCQLAWGPSRLPYRGPGLLRSSPGHLEVTFHDHGQLRVHRVDYGKPVTTGKIPKGPDNPGEVAMGFPACVAAFGPASNGVHAHDAKNVYCPGNGGAVLLTRLGSEAAPKEIAKASPSSENLAAAAFSPEHAVVAYLDRRMVAGELTLEAHAVLDDGADVRISDDGAGATFVSLTPLNDREMLALMIDARTALSPVHARLLKLDGNRLALGPDVIVHVGASERGGSAAVAHFADGTLVALLPMPTDVIHYGLYGIVLPTPLQMDLKGELFPYPKGMEFPRVLTASIGQRVYAAVTRPKDGGKDSPSVLELTEVLKNGSLLPLGLVADGVPMLDVDLAADEHGSLWLLYGDGKGSLLERRVCP